MTYNKNTQIISFVGVSGSGKSTAIDYLSEKGFPKITKENTLDQVEHLVASGQHHMITDELYDIAGYQNVRENIHGGLTVVALVVPKHIRYHRFEMNAENTENHLETTTLDIEEIQLNKTELLGLADYYIMNDGDIEKLHRSIDAVLEPLDFYDV